MKKTIFSLILTMSMIFSAIPTAFAAGVPTEAEVYESLMEMKEEYPQGSPWTSRNQYGWNGGGYGKARGCMAFAHMMSDAAFGNLPARKVYNFTIEDVRVGDVLRNGWDSHSVIVTEVHEDYICIAEGNWNYKVNYERTWSAAEVAAGCYMLTRYPEGVIAEDRTDFVEENLYNNDFDHLVDNADAAQTHEVPESIHYHKQISNHPELMQ